MFINILRKNIGTIIASFGFILLSIIVFGDLGEILTAEYWKNVKDNITAIGFLSISLTMIQVTIKQGVSEQALQRGLNTENTTNKYKEHRQIIKDNNEHMIYIPYFLQIYNERHTLMRKREFLIDNNFLGENALFVSKNIRLIRKYKKIRVYLIASRIKWATTDILYNKLGQIITLTEHRAKRAILGILNGLIFMIGITLLTRGLFFEEVTTPFYQKLVTLITYIIIITMTSILSVIKEYEKGAFGVPNELEEINEVWREFSTWQVPTWVINEVEGLNEQKEVINEKTEERSYSGTDLSNKQEDSEKVEDIKPYSVLVIDNHNDVILLPSDTP